MCDNCNLDFSNLSELQSHMSNIHMLPSNHSAPSNQKHSAPSNQKHSAPSNQHTNIPDNNITEQEADNNSAASTPLRTLHCQHCDFIAMSSRSLKSHMKRHTNDARFVQHPLEQYKCKLCGYVCHHLPSLKAHMWKHASHQVNNKQTHILNNEQTHIVNNDKWVSVKYFKYFVEVYQCPVLYTQ